ncbi:MULTISPECIES: replication initiation and membrane attachment family protein [Aneurinibacillus]|uniref:Replication initiation and membrane attachment protein n=1 Tax=Aneurinibacillus danicus TaxID=267746 RepID=A0A511V143_9BACL|nr:MULTISPECIES: DnaD domain protein [Aneurinibacillus]GEN32636.1 replication initiation and membrane attachment protein [Aneurinibacillus danicus]
MRWQETVPNDPYLIRIKRPISSAEIGYLLHLYQPLMGVMPIALYQTLFHNLSLASFAPVQGLHYGLMVTMSAPLDVIIKARQQLEAIGLLETYQIDSDGEYMFEYVLQPPHAPDVFFRDDTLSIMLLNRVGKEFYRKLRRRFAVAEEQSIPATAKRTRITKAFDEVFCHLSPSEITVEKGTETHQFLQATEEESPLPFFDPKESTVRSYAESRLDFEFLEASLPKVVKRKPVFTKEVKAVLDNLAFTYGIDDETMARLLQEPTVIPEDTIHLAALRRRVKEWYNRENGRVPKISPREEIVFQSDTEAREQEQLLSEAENHARLLESLSPLQLMEYYQHGGKVAPADQKIVEELLEEYQLAPGVVNVLLEYVMLAYDRQLPKDVIYKIAGHWKRNNIQTVQEAKRQARQFYLERKSGRPLFFDKKATSEKKTSARGTSSGKNKRKDEIPPLILEQLERQRKLQEKKQEAPEKEQAVVDPAYEKKRERVKALLKAMEENKQ